MYKTALPKNKYDYFDRFSGEEGDKTMKRINTNKTKRKKKRRMK